MKKIRIVFLLLILFSIKEVRAANYQIKELIPVDTPTTIVTDNFSYKNFYYNDNKMEAESLKNNFIIFENIKNLTDKELPVSISIGLFDENKINIGTVNYCSTNDKYSVVNNTILQSEEEKNYVIEVNKKNLADKKTVNDIKYIAVLSDNINCRSSGSLEFVGKKVEDIKAMKKSFLDNQHTQLVIQIFTILLIIFIACFLYKFLFTNSFRNFNGNDVRDEFKYRNKELAKERKKKKIEKPIKNDTSKSSLIKEQEMNALNSENKDKTDLHNLYK